MRKKQYQMSWQYIAGFFDGEGTIWYKLKKDKKNRTKFSVSMSQSEKQGRVLYEIQKFLKKNLIEAKIYHRKKRDNAMVLEFSNRQEAYKFLIKILPFLIVKQEKAKEAIKAFQEYKGHKALTLEDKIKIKQLLEKGYKAKRIAKILDLNRETVRNAVKRFQAMYGIEQTGNVGPQTLQKLNEIFS
jgi:murein L,D-transpeptidase YcbB/YkuD